jgi:hypothetical protein
MTTHKTTKTMLENTPSHPHQYNETLPNHSPTPNKMFLDQQTLNTVTLSKSQKTMTLMSNYIDAIIPPTTQGTSM